MPTGTAPTSAPARPPSPATSRSLASLPPCPQPRSNARRKRTSQSSAKGLSSIEPDDGGCEVDGAQEVGRPPVVAGCDGPVLLQPSGSVGTCFGIMAWPRG